MSLLSVKGVKGVKGAKGMMEYVAVFRLNRMPSKTAETGM